MRKKIRVRRLDISYICDASYDISVCLYSLMRVNVFPILVVAQKTIVVYICRFWDKAFKTALDSYAKRVHTRTA